MTDELAPLYKNIIVSLVDLDIRPFMPEKAVRLDELAQFVADTSERDTEFLTLDLDDLKEA